VKLRVVLLELSRIIDSSGGTTQSISSLHQLRVATEKKGGEVMNIVIYRHNPVLAERVQRAKPDFVKEFPASMSVEDIRLALPEAYWDLLKQLSESPEGEKLWRQNKVGIYVDGTVMAAGAEFLAKEAPMHLIGLIRQDNVGAYDWYATHIAEAAKGATRVVLVRAKIADHNSEGLSHIDHVRLQEDEAYRQSRESAVVQKWIERLGEHGISPVVVDKIREPYAPFSISPESETLVVGAVVIADHHHVGSYGAEKFIRKNGGQVWFNAYPPFRDDGFLSS